MKIRLIWLLGLGLLAAPCAAQSQDAPAAQKRSWRGVARLLRVEKRGPHFRAWALYPRFARSTPVTRLAGTTLRRAAQEEVGQFARQAKKDFQDSTFKVPDYESQSRLELRFYAPARLVSVAAPGYSYTGGAHGNYSTEALNFGVPFGQKQARPLLLADFFSDKSYRARVERQLLAKLRANKDQEATWILDGTVKTFAPFQLNNFTVEKGGLRWYFAPYAVGPYASGEFEVLLSRAELGPSFRVALLK